jgi:hypothetical protein
MAREARSVDEAKREWMQPWDRRRGIQSWDQNHLSILVDGAVDVVAAALAASWPDGAARWEPDVLGKEVGSTGIFVYRMRGHRWSVVVFKNITFGNVERARDLSRRLGAQVISWGVSDTMGSFGYDLFDRGALVEHLAVFEDDDGEEVLEFTSASGAAGPASVDESYGFAERRFRELDVLEPGIEFVGFFGARQPKPGARGRVEAPTFPCNFGGEILTAEPVFERVDLVIPP